jgi:prealbumin domain-containing protein
MMRLLKWIAFTAALALVATGAAIAWGFGVGKTEEVAADFSASRIVLKESSCTGSDGNQYRSAHESYKGTITGDSRLTGTILLRLKVKEDVRAGLGTASGRMWILSGDGGDPIAWASVTAVKAKGVLNGMFIGHVRSWRTLERFRNERHEKNGKKYLRGALLVANFTAAYDTAGALKGAVGSDSVAPTNTAFISYRGNAECSRWKKGHDEGDVEQTGKLEVKKVVASADDSGKFNLVIDEKTEAANVGNGGSTGEKTVRAGGHLIGETAGTETDLADYASSTECKDANGVGEVVAAGNRRGLKVYVAKDADVVCTITNTHQAGTGKLEVRKVVPQVGDLGRFSLKIDGTVEASNIGTGGSTGEATVSSGEHTISEEEVGETDLDSYRSNIECRDENGTGDKVAFGDGTSLKVNVSKNADVVCVITNSRTSD